MFCCIRNLSLIGLLICGISNPSFSQQEFACGPACFQEILSHFETELTEKDISKLFVNPYDDEMPSSNLLEAAKENPHD